MNQTAFKAELLKKTLITVFTFFASVIFWIWLSSDICSWNSEIDNVVLVFFFQYKKLMSAVLASIIFSVLSWIAYPSAGFRLIYPAVFLLSPVFLLNLILHEFVRFPFYLIHENPVFTIVILLAWYFVFMSSSDTGCLKRIINKIKSILNQKSSIFLVVTCISILANMHLNDHLSMTGDEPHYLNISQSIIENLDFDLSNQIAGYDSSWPADWCRLHHTIRLSDERLISIHSPGMPILIAPFFALGNRYGVSIFFSMVLGLTACLIHLLLLRLVPNSESGWIIVLLSLSCPLVFFSGQIYPEILASLMILLILTGIGSVELKFLDLWTSLLALSFLPWLHSKYALVALLGYLLIYFRFRTKWHLFRVASLIPFMSLALWVTYNFFHFNHYTPFRAYEEFVQSTQLLETNPAYGFGYMIFDGRHGLLLYGPIYIFSILILLRKLKEKTNFYIGLFLIVCTHCLIVFGHVSDRWLGWAPPCRFWIPILPALLVPFIALYDDLKEKSSFHLILFRLFMLFQLYLGIKFILSPSLIHQRIKLFQEKLNGLIHPQSIIPIIPDSADPYHTMLLAVVILLIFSLVIYSKKTTVIHMDSFQSSMNRILGIVFLILVFLGIAHDISERSFSMNRTGKTSALNCLNKVIDHTGINGVYFAVRNDIEKNFDPEHWIWPKQKQAKKAELREYQKNISIELILHDYVEKQRLVKAIHVAQNSLNFHSGESQILEYLLDLYRARRSWEQVIETAQKLLEDPGRIYTIHDLNILIDDSRQNLSHAYLKLSLIENLSGDRKQHFRELSRKYSSKSMGIKKMINFKALPELEEWNK